MPDIHITVKDKIATGDGSRIVCGNSDYMAVFSFDEEWAAYTMKTARFVNVGGSYTDVVFEGNACPVPIIHNTLGVKVGVFAGYLSTTTSAWFDCQKSVLCGSGGLPVDPPPDVYAQIMEKLNRIETAPVSPEAIAAAVAEYLEENPVDPLPDGGTVGDVLTMTEDGAAWAPVTIPKEYGLVTYDQDKTITVS